MKAKFQLPSGEKLSLASRKFDKYMAGFEGTPLHDEYVRIKGAAK